MTNPALAPGRTSGTAGVKAGFLLLQGYPYRMCFTLARQVMAGPSSVLMASSSMVR